ncbi:ino eighty subunit 1 [Grosmannia clavigera kw1407]|uniref:Ino eighty subunit 1 n=1 Tax=Grosmannia clavigera (strain kw1407 / UAMH 11150) TaxID=655863 RepID=F0XHA9_GROCL|nr:ino eighty subunit 1 [Grosmannia clavigera kw1407]EFX03130.1 ino eighty subunit 1 [Grosmannia clavigera kw1407]
MASPSSAAGFSEGEQPTPSPHHLDKSFLTNANASMTEDEDTLTAQDPSAIGKIRHLKKEDGEPLWRYDIQYDFLRAVFDDEREVFTNSYEPSMPSKQCFADLYIDTMARSSKTSKILHDKLLSDRNAAKSMAMVCLLVNIGRMNTTLNCPLTTNAVFPEMRAQLRTYHAIPSLQVQQDAHAYKQLQDAPRLKSILKGGSEDRAEPRTLDTLKDQDVPRTNPVNLIFLICHSAAKVAELHFPPGREFHDLIMRTNLSSKSRAAAFLWIMWFYLESDFTEEGCEENPFGAGVDYDVDVANQGVPMLEELTPEEEGRENQDTAEEREFGIAKKNQRSAILRDEQLFTDSPPVKRSSRTSARPSAVATMAKELSAAPDGERSGPPAILPRIRPSKHDSDVESTRSTPPPRSLNRSFGPGGPGGSTTSRRAGPLKYQIIEGSSPARQPPLLQQMHQQQQQQLLRKRGSRPSQKAVGRMPDTRARTRRLPRAAASREPPTAHQIAVENNRKQRIEYLLSRGMQRKHHRAGAQDGAIVRAYRRLQQVEDPFEDSENEDNVAWNRGIFSFQPGAPQTKVTGDAFRERGFGGIVLLNDEQDDFGEEVSAYSAAIRRAARRMNRWEETKSTAVVAPMKRQRVHVTPDDDYPDPNETEEEMDLDGDHLDMSLLEVPQLPLPTAMPSSTKRRRTTGAEPGAGGIGGTPSGRAKGSSSRAAGKAAGGGTATANGRRRRPAAAAPVSVTNDEDGGSQHDGSMIPAQKQGAEVGDYPKVL